MVLGARACPELARCEVVWPRRAVDERGLRVKFGVKFGGEVNVKFASEVAKEVASEVASEVRA